MTNGYKTKEYGQPTKRFVQTMELKDDCELIRKYREAHDKEHFWDEIGEGIKAVGILEMEIYILGNRLVMMHEGRVVYDVSGEEKSALTVEDLLKKFEQTAGMVNDRLILA